MANLQEDGNLGEKPTRSDLIIPILAQDPYESITDSATLPYPWVPVTPGFVYNTQTFEFLSRAWLNPDGKKKDFSGVTPEDAFEFLTTFHEKRMAEERAEHHSESAETRSNSRAEGSKTHWYFLTYTQNNDFDLDADTMVSVIRRLDTVNDRSASILHYEGCIEHCQSGKIHAHVIVHLSASPSGGVKKFFEGRYTLKKMKIGNIHVRRVNFKTNPSSLEDMRAYCAKEGFRKIENKA